MLNENEKKIQELRKEISHHDRRYYVYNDPQISDREYDRLYAELVSLEEDFPDLLTADSPTQRVSGSPSSEFVQIRHSVPLLSMDNTYSEDDLKKFDKRMRKLFAEHFLCPVSSKKIDLDSITLDYIVEPKVDGVAVSLMYKNGKLIHGATRGDGKVGDDITNNIKTIRSVPLSIANWKKEDEGCLDVRGEAFMLREKFEGFNTDREKEGLVAFANSRNATGGSLKILDAKEVAKRPLDIMFYNLGLSEVSSFESHESSMKWLKNLGFKLVETKRCRGIKEAIEYCLLWESKKKQVPYDIDGMVVKLDWLFFREKIGATNKSPRWQVAYKFAEERVETTVEKISIQVAKSGNLTPVAHLTPVQISGTTVSRVILHKILPNKDEPIPKIVLQQDVRIGDTIKVEKAGGIIPKVVEVIKGSEDQRNAPFAMPKECPVCEAFIDDKNWGVCKNPTCSAKIKAILLHFISKKAMNIQGFGPSLIDKLVDNQLVASFADLYDLTYESLINLPGMADLGTKKILKGIEDSKNQDLGRFLFGLGVANTGKGTSDLIAQHYADLEHLRILGCEELKSNPKKFGKNLKVTAQNLSDFFSQDSIKAQIQRLKKHGLKAIDSLTPLTEELSSTIENLDKEEPFFLQKRLSPPGKNFNPKDTLELCSSKLNLLKINLVREGFSKKSKESKGDRCIEVGENLMLAFKSQDYKDVPIKAILTFEYVELLSLGFLFSTVFEGARDNFSILKGLIKEKINGDSDSLNKIVLVYSNACLMSLFILFEYTDKQDNFGRVMYNFSEKGLDQFLVCFDNTLRFFEEKTLKEDIVLEKIKRAKRQVSCFVKAKPEKNEEPRSLKNFFRKSFPVLFSVDRYANVFLERRDVSILERVETILDSFYIHMQIFAILRDVDMNKILDQKEPFKGSQRFFNEINESKFRESEKQDLSLKENLEKKILQILHLYVRKS
ncbi:DNA ligase (NAD(+)) LigA [PVC group bacterium (ex Bugula neritina AB1)]|nr:DNA ligase (NAD(+)) LigA [PVC group bacterium (ex Bugula neritina AB1)]